MDSTCSDLKEIGRHVVSDANAAQGCVAIHGESSDGYGRHVAKLIMANWITNLQYEWSSALAWTRLVIPAHLIVDFPRRCREDSTLLVIRRNGDLENPLYVLYSTATVPALGIAESARPVAQL